jgi:hypothetical protein
MTYLPYILHEDDILFVPDNGTRQLLLVSFNRVLNDDYLYAAFKDLNILISTDNDIFLPVLHSLESTCCNIINNVEEWNLTYSGILSMIRHIIYVGLNDFETNYESHYSMLFTTI